MSTGPDPSDLKEFLKKLSTLSKGLQTTASAPHSTRPRTAQETQKLKELIDALNIATLGAASTFEDLTRKHHGLARLLSTSAGRSDFLEHLKKSRGGILSTVRGRPLSGIPSPEAATRAIGRPAMMGMAGLLGSAIGGAIGGGPGAAIGGIMAAMAAADMDIPGAEVPKPPAGATTWQKFKWAMHLRNIFASQLRTLGMIRTGLAAGLPALVTSKIMEEATRRQQQVSTLEGGGGAAVRSDNALSSLIQRITSQARVHPGNRW